MSKPKVRMRWEFHESQNARAILHVDSPMFDSSNDSEMVRKMRKWVERIAEQLDRSPESLTEGLPDDLPGEQKEFLDQLRGLRGITYAGVRPYQVGIGRSLVFDWEELMPHVEKIVAEYLGAEPEIREPFRCECRPSRCDDED